MDLSGLRIVADERERKSGIPGMLKAVGINTEVRTLPIADYITGPETAVERKSIQDLVSSVFDGRLFEQCSRLKENYARPVIVVEGDPDSVEKVAENPFVFYGALSRVALEFQIPVIPTPSAEHTVKLLVSLCTQRGSAKGPFVKKIKKSDDLARQQLSVLASLPGVGEKLAGRMLEKFGDPGSAMAAKASELARVEGLGAARAKRIRSVLDSKKRGKRATGQKRLDGRKDSS